MQAVYLSPSEIDSGTNSSAVITYHVSIRHSPHTLNSHTRPSSETPGLALLSSSAPSELYERRACLLDVEKDYTRKKNETGAETERDRVNTLCGIHSWLIRLTFLSLVTNRTTMREQARNGVAMGRFGECSGRDTAPLYEYPHINESHEFLLDFHLIIFDGSILCVVCLNLNLIALSSSQFCLPHRNFNIH